MVACASCGAEDPRFRCPCRTVRYCDATCQRRHRSFHRPQCRPTVADRLDQYHRNFATCAESTPDCAICLDPLDRGAYRLACGHRFHEACLKPGMYRCPLCRAFCMPAGAEGVRVVDMTPEELLEAMLGYVYTSKAADDDRLDTGAGSINTSVEAAEFARARLAAVAPIMDQLATGVGQAKAAIRDENAELALTRLLEVCGLALGDRLADFAVQLSRWLHELFV